MNQKGEWSSKARKLYGAYRKQYPLEDRWDQLSKWEKRDWEKIVKEYETKKPVEYENN